VADGGPFFDVKGEPLLERQFDACKIELHPHMQRKTVQIRKKIFFVTELVKHNLPREFAF
jgi:hypothetical protein